MNDECHSCRHYATPGLKKDSWEVSLTHASADMVRISRQFS